MLFLYFCFVKRGSERIEVKEKFMRFLLLKNVHYLTLRISKAIVKETKQSEDSFTYETNEVHRRITHYILQYSPNQVAGLRRKDM